MTDKEKKAVAWKKWYAKNREQYLAKQRAKSNTEEKRSKDRIRMALWREKNRELIRAKRREYMSKNGTRWRHRYPDRVRARQLVEKAIRSGELIRQPCWCGALGEAHHDDYDKPYQVRWLCNEHHAEHHRKTRHGRPRG